MDPSAASTFSEAPGLPRFLRWMTIAAIVAGLAAGSAFLLTGDRLFATGALLALGLGGWLFLVSQPLLQAGRTTAAVVTASAGLLLTSLLIAVVVPQAALGTWVVPLLTVAMALHVFEQRALVQLMAISWAVGAAAALLGELERNDSPLPVSGATLVYIGGWGIVAALVMYLLAQLSTRVRDALDLSADANVALQQADDQLTQVNDELRHQVDELERHSEERSLLAQLGDLLEACQKQTAPPFPSALLQVVVGAIVAADAGETLPRDPPRSARANRAERRKAVGRRIGRHLLRVERRRR